MFKIKDLDLLNFVKVLNIRLSISPEFVYMLLKTNYLPALFVKFF